MSDWCILRTASRNTLRLAASLAKDGFEVWTPIEERVVRVPRFNVRRPVTRAMLGGVVFARAAHLVDLLELARMPVKPRRGAGLREPAHASFSVMHWHDGIAWASERQMTELRRIAAKRMPVKRAAYSFPRGTSARCISGICGGMTGIVVRSSPKITVLRFNGGPPWEIPTCLLELDEVCKYQNVALAA